MNRREMIKRIAGMGAVVGIGGAAVMAAPASKPFIRMKAGDLGSERTKVFLDGHEVTSDCRSFDTQRGEVELFERPLRAVDGRLHMIFKRGAVRVELDGKVYTS